MANKSDDEDLFNFPSPEINNTPHPEFKVEEDTEFAHLDHLNKKLF